VSRRFHVDLRFLVAGVLALIAAGAVFVLTAPVTRISILVADDTLAPGARLGDLPIGERPMEPIPGTIAAADRQAVADLTLTVPVAAGSPILETMLASDRPTSDVVAVTLDPGNAAQGQLLPGDLVDLYVTDDEGTRLVASAVTVVDATIGAGGFAGSEVALLLAVDRGLAHAVIEGMRSGSLDLVRRGR
jgi:Flp pilus assembly protein CpaB